jgi:hypothetical protein
MRCSCGAHARPGKVSRPLFILRLLEKTVLTLWKQHQLGGHTSFPECIIIIVKQPNQTSTEFPNDTATAQGRNCSSAPFKITRSGLASRVTDKASDPD